MQGKKYLQFLGLAWEFLVSFGYLGWSPWMQQKEASLLYGATRMWLPGYTGKRLQKNSQIIRPTLDRRRKTNKEECLTEKIDILT